MSVWGELKRRNVFKAGAAYVVGAWLLLQILSVFGDLVGLPEGLGVAVLVLLSFGFPLVLLIAWAFELTPAGLKLTRDVPANESIAHDTGKKLNHILIGLAAGAIIGTGATWLLGRDTAAQWARDEGLPQIEAYLDAGDWEAAFSLAAQVEDAIPEDRLLTDLWSRLSWMTTIRSEPAGATVYRRPYASDESDWEVLGVTPLERIRIPLGPSRFRFELEGYRSLQRTIGGNGSTERTLPVFDLDTDTSVPEGMVRVPGWTATINGETVDFRDFLLSRYEVTNEEFQRFVDAGGYQRPELWEYDLVLNGETIGWEEGMALFVDRTGRQGPSTWVAGTYPDGQADFPVAGVSWYEAEAYARFVGQQLPTIHQWRRAFSPNLLPAMLPKSNIESAGAARVGDYDGMSWVEAFDMVGNVREWVFNATGNQRLIVGGGWNDAAYIAQAWNFSQPAFDRSATNGIRLAAGQDSDSVIELASRPMGRVELPDVLSLPIVSDEHFEAYRSQFEYDLAPLEAVVEESQVSAHWTRERITFNAPYGGERMALYLYLPTKRTQPYQTVVFWPGSSALELSSIDQFAPYFDFLLKNGRAVAFPVYDKTFERRDGGPFPVTGTVAHRDLFIRNVQDVRRSIDYLETREDIASDALAYFGHSWGGFAGPLVLAVEPRLDVSVLYVAGFPCLTEGGPFCGSRDVLPEIDIRHYLPRIDMPVLMLNGEYDPLVSLNAAARPFFELLGTQESDKRFVVAPGGHYVPRNTLIGETLAWLDKYLGNPSS